MHSGRCLQVQEPADLTSFTENRSVQSTLSAQHLTVYLPPEDGHLQSLRVHFLIQKHFFLTHKTDPHIHLLVKVMLSMGAAGV